MLGAPQSRAVDAAFAPASLDPPPLDLNLRIGALDLGAGQTARRASARLRMDRGRLDLDDVAMDLGGARAAGRLTLRRDAALAAVTGEASVEPVAVDQPALRGRIGGELTFAGSGDSLGALIGGLAGEGRIELRGAATPHLDPGALTRVLARAQSGDIGIDETNVGYNLGLELDRAALPLPDGAAPATLSAGVIHVGPLAISRAGGSATASAAFDLRAQSLALDVAFAEARGGKFWIGPPPAVDVSLTGALAAPARRIDASPLAAGLAAQAIGRDTDRISALEADIRERAWFNRRLKAEKYMRQREAELAALRGRAGAAEGGGRSQEGGGRPQEGGGGPQRAEEDAAANAQRPSPPADVAKPAPPPNPPAARRPPQPPAGRRRAAESATRPSRAAARQSADASAAAEGRGGRSDRDRLLLRRVFEHVDADRRGQIGAVARRVDFGDHGADRAAPRRRERLEAAPERVLERHAGAVAGDRQRTLDDRRARRRRRRRSSLFAARLAAMAFERALGAFAFGARFALGRLADAMGEAIGRRGRLVLIAAALLAGAAEVDDLAQAEALIHFLLRNASIETTFAGSASRGRSAFFAAGSADLADAAAPAFAGAAGGARRRRSDPTCARPRAAAPAPWRAPSQRAARA